MIVRIWEGEVSLEDSESYFEYLQKTGIRDYLRTKGNRGVFVLQREEDGRASFLLLTLWESMEAISDFSGEPVDQARYYPEDEDYLLELRPTVDHYRLRLIRWPGQEPPTEVSGNNGEGD